MASKKNPPVKSRRREDRSAEAFAWPPHDQDRVGDVSMTLNGNSLTLRDMSPVDAVYMIQAWIAAQQPAQQDTITVLAARLRDQVGQFRAAMGQGHGVPDVELPAVMRAGARESAMPLDLNPLVESVTAVETVGDSFITFAQGLAAEIEANAGNQAVMTELAARLRSQAGEFAQAMTTNTDSEGEEPGGGGETGGGTDTGGETGGGVDTGTDPGDETGGTEQPPARRRRR